MHEICINPALDKVNDFVALIEFALETVNGDPDKTETLGRIYLLSIFEPKRATSS